MNETNDIPMETKILKTAEKLFLDKGFALTSTTEIAKKAGCNQALVHYYFRTKEKLFQKIFEEKILLFASRFLSAGEVGYSFEDKLARIIEAHFDILYQNPKLPLFLINQLTLNPEHLSQIMENTGYIPLQVLRMLEAELATEIEKGTIRKTSIPDIILSMVSLNAFLFISQPIVAKITGMSDRELDEFTRSRKKEHVRVILASLKP